MNEFKNQEKELQVEENINEPKEGFDIEFEDDVDLDKYQRQFSQNDNAETIETKEGIGIPSLVFDQPILNKQKKYVIYINPENIDFIENLPIPERKRLINDILTNQVKITEKQKIAKRQKRFFTHLITACFSAIIFLPLAFFIINKSIELSIINYNQAEKNFEKLYKERGKLKARENVYGDLK